MDGEWLEGKITGVGMHDSFVRCSLFNVDDGGKWNTDPEDTVLDEEVRWIDSRDTDNCFIEFISWRQILDDVITQKHHDDDPIAMIVASGELAMQIQEELTEIPDTDDYTYRAHPLLIDPMLEEGYSLLLMSELGEAAHGDTQPTFM